MRLLLSGPTDCLQQVHCRPRQLTLGPQWAHRSPLENDTETGSKTWPSWGLLDSHLHSALRCRNQRGKSGGGAGGVWGWADWSRKGLAACAVHLSPTLRLLKPRTWSRMPAWVHSLGISSFHDASGGSREDLYALTAAVSYANTTAACRGL